MHHFFAKRENIFEDFIVLDGTDVNHIKNVLRLRCGEEILISSGDNIDYYCTVSELGADEVRATILRKDTAGHELPSKLYLFQGLPKGDKMEWIIMKAVELGACEVIPVAMRRCVVKLDAKKEASKLKRWNAIAQSAAEQSRRSILPKVSNVLTFAEAVEQAKGLDVVLMPYECAEGMDAARSVIRSIAPGQSVGIFIGPEGGLDWDEIDLAQKNGFQIITLGKRILRTETAGMMLLSVLMCHLEA